MDHFAGLDVSVKETSICIVDDTGRIVALARRLAVIMHRIWVDGTEFRWAREQAAAAA
jgi:hypothetical protein